MSVQRYSELAGSAFEPDPEGYWVKFEDMAAAMTAGAERMAEKDARIAELERDLQATEADLERLMALHYGEGDERDHMRIAVDRAAELMKEKEG